MLGGIFCAIFLFQNNIYIGILIVKTYAKFLGIKLAD